MEHNQATMVLLLRSMGHTLDESLALVGSLGSGKLSRVQFQEWYERRRSEGTLLASELRKQVPVIAEPVAKAVEFGRAILEDFSASPAARMRPSGRHRRAHVAPLPARRARKAK